MIFNFNHNDVVRRMLDKRNKEVIENQYEVDLLLFGDSITRRFDIGRYVPTRKRILNSGIGGDRLYYMQRRFEEDVLKLRPKEVLFMGGINDVINWYLEEKENEDYIISYVVKSYESIIKNTKENKIVIYPALLIKTHQLEYNYTYINSVITKINKELLKLEDVHNVKFIDYNKVLCNEYGDLSLDLATDGLHPDEVGFLKMSKILIKNKIV